MWTTDIENYPGFPDPLGGQELMQRMRDHATGFGARVVTENVTSVDLSERPFRLQTSGGGVIEAAAVIVATGARANWLGLHNEERPARTGGGVSACAVCAGALPRSRDKRLAVVGGGAS